MRTRTCLAVVVAFTVLAASCGGDGGDTEDRSRREGEPAAPSRGSSDGIRDALAVAGIEIIEDPADSAGTGLELWSYQVENMAREIDDGAGFLGSQLDELAGEPGGVPFSYLLAGWLDVTPTPIAEQAQTLMGDQPWEQAPALVFPSAVLMLFVADGLQASGALEATAAVDARLVSFAQSGVCSTLAGWVNRALSFIFDSLKVEVDADGGFFDWLGSIWNAAVDLLRDVVEGLIETLTAPIVAAIAGALGVVGTLSMVASLLQPWSLDLEPTNAVTRFALAGEPNVQESVVAKADPGYEFEWPGYLEDCASVAGLTLPNPTDAEGSAILWKQRGFPDLGSVTELDEVIDDNNEAKLDWVTAREESDEGDENSGTVAIAASVDLKQIEQLKSMLTTLITSQIPSGPFEGLVAEVFSALAEPVFDTLAELIRIKGTTSIEVIYHDEPEEDTTTTSSELFGAGLCVVGTWTANGVDAAAIYAQGLGIAAYDPYAEGSVIAEFDEDGTVTIEFDNWTIGNRTFTESPIEGVISDLTGDTYTQSNGTAAGTWKVIAALIDISLGQLDVAVIQRVISEELEIDSTIDAPAGFARLYLIPSNPTRFLCEGDQLAIEWENGAAVRWFRTG